MFVARGGALMLALMVATASTVQQASTSIRRVTSSGPCISRRRAPPPRASSTARWRACTRSSSAGDRGLQRHGQDRSGLRDGVLGHGDRALDQPVRRDDSPAGAAAARPRRRTRGASESARRPSASAPTSPRSRSSMSDAATLDQRTRVWRTSSAMADAGGEVSGRSRSGDLLGAVADRLGAADRQDLRESAQGRRNARKAVPASSRTIPASRTTSFTATTCRRWPIAAIAAAQRYADDRARRRRTRCTCRRTRSRASAPGRNRSTRTSRPRRPRAKANARAEAAARDGLHDLRVSADGAGPRGRALIERLPEIAAAFDPNAVTGAAPGSAGVFALAAMPARWALERRDWAAAAALAAPARTPVPYADAMTHFARALGAAHTRRARRRARVDRRAAGDQRSARAGEGGVLGRAGARFSAMARPRFCCWPKASATRP